MEVNIRNFVGKPPLPNRRRPPTPNEPLSELQSNPSRDNYLLPKLMKMVTVQAHSLGKTHYTPSSEQLIDRSNMRKRNTASRETSQKPLSGKKASLKSEYSEEETDNEGRFGPQISASSWIIYEANRSKFIHGKRIFKKREIASLTKIMNLAVVIDTIRRCQLDARRLKVRVTRQTAEISGTTAFLREGMEMSVFDLMYGMMLPSGNNAAYALALAIGSVLLMQAEGKLNYTLLYDVEAFFEYYCSRRNNLSMFLSQMNRKAKSLNMFNSFFANPHGLSQTNNLSTAEDMAKLCSHCLKDDLFRRVVNTKVYKANYELLEPHIIKETDEYGQDVEWTEFRRSTYHLQWQNTNKLLWEGWSGVKTGITPNAGPCLAASLNRYISGQEYCFVVVLINSTSMEARWKEAKQLVSWVVAEGLY